MKKVESLTKYNSCGIISLTTSRCSSKELRALHIEEDSTGVFHLYILPSKNAAETTTNAARYNITRSSFSPFPNISQYTYDVFVTFAKNTLQRILDIEPLVAHVDKNWWRYHYLYRKLPIFCLLPRIFVVQLRLLGNSSNFMLLFVAITVWH